MSGLNKDRKRNQSISFHMSIDEKRLLEARINISGLPKGTYFIQSLLEQKIEITVGKYQSDRLSLEVKRLHEALDALPSDGEGMTNVLDECKALIGQLVPLIKVPNLIDNELASNELGQPNSLDRDKSL